MEPMRTRGFHAQTGPSAVLAVAVLAGSMSCGSPAEEVGTVASSIIGGADDSGDPAVVAIVSDTVGLTLCSGALVGPRAVLTAGHCNFTKITARFGADVTAPERKIAVVRTVQHPKYTAMGAPYDFALLELETPLTDIAPLALRTAPLSQADVGKTLIRHVGFGVSDEAAGSGAGRKRTVSYLVTKVTDALVYSGAPGKQTCDLDSGAPGLVTEGDGVERIAGVVSDGPNCHTDGWDGRADLADLGSFIADTQKSWDAPPPSDARSGGCASTPADRVPDGGALLLLAALIALARRITPSRA